MAGKFGQKAPAAQAPVAKEPKNIQILDVRTIQTQKGPKQQVKFGKGVEVFYNGTKVDLGEYNSAFAKDNEEHENDLSYFVEKGIMTEEQANQDVNFIQEKGISLRVKVPNPKLQS